MAVGLRDYEHLLALATQLEMIIGEMAQSKTNQTMVLMAASTPQAKGKEVLPSTQQTPTSQTTIPNGALEGKTYKLKNRHPKNTLARA